MVIPCQNRFDPLIGFDAMDSDLDIVDFNTNVGDAVTYGPEQNMNISEIERTQGWDKVDKASSSVQLEY